MLDQAGIGYKVVDAMENADLRVKYQVMAAPTLVVSNGESAEKIHNLSNIKKYTESFN